jgi:hypothetical protein
MNQISVKRALRDYCNEPQSCYTAAELGRRLSTSARHARSVAKKLGCRVVKVEGSAETDYHPRYWVYVGVEPEAINTRRR